MAFCDTFSWKLVHDKSARIPSCANYYLLTYIHSYCSTLRHSKSLDLLNYEGLIIPINSLLSPSLNPHLPPILLQIFQPSQTRSSPSTSLRFTFKYFLNCPSLIHSCYMSNPFQALLFSIRYYVYIFIHLPQYLISSYSPYSLLYLRSM